MRVSRVIPIENRNDAQRCLREIGADPVGVGIMVPKGVFRAVLVKDVPARTANILKQEMLSKGGEAAVRRETVLAEGRTDVLLFGTLRQYQLLLKKLRMQPFGLKHLAGELETLLARVEMNEPQTIALAGGKQLELMRRPLVMGILNVTPDSFSDGGLYLDPAKAAEHALEMVAEGADIIDIGGFSTRPGAEPVSAAIETERVLPVLKAVRGQFLGPISVDTFRASVAREALAAGADIINDVSGLKADPDLAGIIADAGCAAILMHYRMQGGAYHDLVDEVIAELAESMQISTDKGIDPKRIMLDPGIGFGKTAEENLVLLKQLKVLHGLGRPLVVGASRKSFIGKILNVPPPERGDGSVGAAVAAYLNGAAILRVHDVRASRHALDVAAAIRTAESVMSTE
ncbi:MAG: dihydropteroate synthase [Solirubrobacterales bacterium]